MRLKFGSVEVWVCGGSTFHTPVFILMPIFVLVLVLVLVYSDALGARLSHSGSRSISSTGTSTSTNSPQQSKPVVADDGVIHSKRLATGVPLGGIGCGTFQLMTDGSVSHATINNNGDQPSGDLDGCFSAIWTNAGGRIVSKALHLKNRYGLAPIASLNYRGLFPQAYLEYPDRELPVKLSLHAFSSLIPHDVMNSSLPAAHFVFKVTNESRGPVEVSIALSWENILGVGGSAHSGRFSDRTGNSIAPIPSSAGQFGLRFGGPAIPANLPLDRLRYNATGSYALMGLATAPDATVSTAVWNVRDDRPAWITRFARDGILDGAGRVGNEGDTHPAGVIAIKLALKDKETREIPFVFSWYTPRQWTLTGSEYGHYYEKAYDDPVEIGRFALENRLTLSALTDEWQNLILRSSLPAWLSRKLINDSSVLFTNTIHTRDSGLSGPKPGPSLFATIENTVDGKGALGGMDQMPMAAALISAWFPDLEIVLLRLFTSIQLPSGEIPRHLGNIDERIVSPGSPAASKDGVDSSCGFIYLIYRRFLFTGDQRFLDEFYPAAKHAAEYLAPSPLTGSAGSGEDPGKSGPRIANSASYHWTMKLAALEIARLMAVVMADKRFEMQCAAWLKECRKEGQSKLWNGQFLRSEVNEGGRVTDAKGDTCSALQLAGQWMSDELDGPDLLPAEMLKNVIDKLAVLNDRASKFGPVLEVDAVGKAVDTSVILVPQSITYQAALYAARGYPNTAIELLRRINSITDVNGAAWLGGIGFRTDNGQSLGSGSPISGCAVWNVFTALEGVRLEVPNQRLVLVPHLSSDMHSLIGPVFAPGFIGAIEYRPGPRRNFLSFRLDRVFPIGAKRAGLQTGPGLEIKHLVIPAVAEKSDVFVSIGKGTVPGKITRDSRGRTVFTLDAPVKMTAGERIDINIR